MTDEAAAHLRIAVLGIGIMGGPIARHLSAAGHEVSAWDIDAERLGALGEHGVHPAGGPDEAVAGADVLITMLTDADTTASLVGALLDRFTGTWIQSATVGLEGTDSLLELARQAEVAMVDCPMLGTRSSAESGELTALASGPEDSRALVTEVLGACARQVLWLGDAGRGSRLKLVMNNWVIGIVGLTAETIALAHGLGFSAEDFLGLIAGGPLDVAQAHIKGEAMERGEFAPALPLRHAAKDAGLIRAAAHDAGLTLPIADAHAETFMRAVRAGHGDEDMAAVIRVLERAATSDRTG
jgi:3-hydroxyisobutyrate dehydrogenase